LVQVAPAKSPIGKGVRGVQGIAVHGQSSGAVAVAGRKKQNPRSGGRPGASRNCLVATLVSRAPVGYQARSAAKPIPIKRTGGRPCATAERGAASTGGQRQRGEGMRHVNLQGMRATLLQPLAPFNPETGAGFTVKVAFCPGDL